MIIDKKNQLLGCLSAPKDLYFLSKRPEHLTISDIDSEILETVCMINNSGWVWTSSCCQGDKGNFPFLKLHCEKEKFADFSLILFETAKEIMTEFVLQDGTCISYHGLNYTIAPYITSFSKDSKYQDNTKYCSFLIEANANSEDAYRWFHNIARRL